MNANPSEKLAIHGGEPYRREPFPRRVMYDDREIAKVTEALRSQTLFQFSGKLVGEFERKFAEAYGMKHARAATSGTAAIHVAVGTVDPNPGDEIITAPITDFGSIGPILQQNAIPVFADVRPDTLTMDPADIEKKITARTKAIILVHLFGTAADVDTVLEIARPRGIPVIEDCAQAHRTKYKGRWLGTIGDLGCFSFQESKLMSTGDGGMVITNREDYWDRMRLFVDKGFARSGWGPRCYQFLGPNYRMSELTAAVGLCQLEKVDGVVQRRKHIGQLLSSLLEPIDGVLPATHLPESEHSFWLYPLRVTHWSAVKFGEALKEEGIPNMPGYTGVPMYLCSKALTERRTFGTSRFPIQDRTYAEGLCPVAEKAMQEFITIWFHESYSDDDIRDIAGGVAKVAAKLEWDK
ncbi:MAG TPA: DegT/DnrJ/EryC1/StrS family aminotransferase [bacterium]|nr:DegT/DnrJ/EryC1/StrS family aminotransferase [bacterium]HQO34261.1 DegT/DnrJ/EryC1/StrS family aminotransferase [bacterium]HQQ00441.1 DegT/DnrJ/EryC1/StrS family aminotransferase [bacterium]